MNIFFLSENPYTAARWHGDKHVSKMLIETAQMLSTAHHVLSPEADNFNLYKPTHVSHPCSVWVRENACNYDWTWHLLNGLCLEFYIRRGKNHATSLLRKPLRVRPDLTDVLYKVQGHTPPALAMPDVFKCEDPVEAYRAYYRDKFRQGIVSYDWSSLRHQPEWLTH